MKKILIALAVLCAACGSPSTVEFVNISTTSRKPGTPVKTTPHLDDKVYRVVIDGMDCLVWKDKINSGNSSYAYSGLTCDWSMKERR